MGITSLAGHFFLKLQTSFFLFLNRHHHTTANASTPTLTQPAKQHIPPLTATYYHLLPHTNTTKHHQHTTKHNTHFQHRYWPTSFHVGRGLHKNSCFLHNANMSDRQGTSHGPRTLTLRQVRAVFTKRADWKSDHCQRAVKREREEKERERHEKKREGDTRRERHFRVTFETLSCVRSKRPCPL